MQKDKSSVCAVIVTYNRRKLLDECLDSLIRQTRKPDTIIIIDNASTDGTFDYLKQKGYLNEVEQYVLMNNELNKRDISGITNQDEDIEVEYSTNSEMDGVGPKIRYVESKANLGGAGGFYHGVKMAFHSGFDWIWIMDDDAEPEIDCLEELLKFANDNNYYSFFAPVINHESGAPEYYHHKKKIDLEKCREITLRDSTIDRDEVLEANAFVGPLIGRAAISKVGFPDPSYFIWLDDLEYTYRLTTKVGNGVLVKDAKIIHKDILPQDSSDSFNWKIYFALRNSIKFYFKYAGLKGKFWLSLRILRSYLRYYRNADDKLKLFSWSIGYLFLRNK